jgi:hypothetical protein
MLEHATGDAPHASIELAHQIIFNEQVQQGYNNKTILQQSPLVKNLGTPTEHGSNLFRASCPRLKLTHRFADSASFVLSDRGHGRPINI